MLYDRLKGKGGRNRVGKNCFVDSSRYGFDGGHLYRRSGNTELRRARKQSATFQRHSILTGGKDSWGDGESCPEFTEWLNKQRVGVVTLTVYPNVHHGFDHKGSWSGYAPYAINKTAVLQWDAEAANDGRERAVNFLRRVFDL